MSSKLHHTFWMWGPTLYLPMEELYSKPFFLLKVAKFPSSPCLVKLNSTLEDCGGKFKSFPSTQYAEWCQYCIGTNLSAWFNTKHVEAEQLQFKMRNSEMTGIPKSLKNAFDRQKIISSDLSPRFGFHDFWSKYVELYITGMMIGDIVKNPKRNCKDSRTVPTTEFALCNVCSKMISGKKA